MTRTRIIRRASAHTFALLLAAGVAGQAGAEELPSAYVMTVFDDRAQGQQVVSGDYDQAIAALTESGYGNASLEIRNNLCVAYAMANDLPKAEKACMQALRSRSKSAAFWNHSFRAREDRAVAYSNRGVIRAISGDVEGAMEDFRRAVRLSGTFEPAAHNLARLRARTTQAVSSVKHAH